MLADSALQLPEGKHRLHQPGSTHWMPAGDQPSRRIHRTDWFFGQLQPVVNARHEGLTTGGKPPALPIAAQTHVLVGLDLRRGIGIVQLNEADFLKWVLDTSMLVSLPRGHPPGAEGVHARIAEAVLPQFLVILACVL